MLKPFTPQSTGDFWPSAELSHSKELRFGWRRIALTVQKHFALMAEQREVRRAEGRLESLDDHLLKDIGISRSEIGRAVRYGRGT